MQPHAKSRATAVCLAIAALTVAAEARSDNFSDVHYDAAKGELVVTMLYRGTNPDHTFSIRWGACNASADHGQEVAAELLDSQFQDAARHNFRKTVRLSLVGMPCRPARLTLRTAPRFFYTLQIPAASAP